MVRVQSRRDSIGIRATGFVLLLYAIVVANDPIPEEADRNLVYASLGVALAFGAFAVWRSFRLGVSVGGNAVVVYNLLRTHRVPRDKVARFVVGRLRRIDRSAVVLEKLDGEHVIVSALSLSPFESLHGSDRVAKFVGDLNAALEWHPNQDVSR